MDSRTQRAPIRAGRSARPPRARAVGLALALPALLAAGPPEPVRVQVPAAKVESYFPLGTQLRGMAADRFEALVRDAREGYHRLQGRTAPRLLRARHAARWEDGVLVGRSELAVAPAGAGPSDLALEPWSPAIDPADAGPARLRVDDAGRAAIRLDPAAPATITLRWHLRARPLSKGRGFSLDLPAADVASLTLDLPDGLVPEGPEGVRQGPTPVAGGGRASWRFDGRGGKADLRLRDRAEAGVASPDLRPWVSGPTRVELAEGAARWTTEWTVAADPRGPRRLSFELDPGLELIDVTGPGVAEARAEPAGSATRVTVVLEREVPPTTTMTIRAMAKVPDEGAWLVPAVRPLDALWTGGTTTIKLDPGRVLKDCREEAGRRVAARPGEGADAGLIAFEAFAPAPVASLTFREPWADVSAEVRGQLLLGNSAPRLEAQITWRVHRGRPLRLDVDLPPAWAPDLVQFVGIDEPVSWHPEARPGGGVRVHVVPPAIDPTRGPIVLRLDATATIAGGRGPLALPRVRPVGVRVADELWLAWSETGLALHPTSARGLAWIDPRLVAGPAPRRVESLAAMHQALAWRWTSDRAEAQVARERVESDPTGMVHLTAAVGRGRLRLDCRVVVEAGAEPIRTIPIALDDPAGAEADDWHFRDEATGLELARRPLDAPGLAAAGLPEAGPGWALDLPSPRPGRVVVRSHREVPWTGLGRVPLLVLPARFHASGIVLVEADRGVRTTAEAAGLRTLDPSSAAEAMGEDDRDEWDDLHVMDRPGRRRAHAFGYGGPGGRLVLRTEDLEPARIGGVVAQAVLTTSLDPEGLSRHRLTLRVANDRPQPIVLTLPAGATPVRVRRDGQSVSPVATGRSLSIPLPATTPSRPFCTVTLDYQTERGASPSGSTLRPECPSSSLPCLGFRWEVLAPEGWSVSARGAGLVDADPSPTSAWARRLLDSRRAWGLSAASPTEDEAAMLGALDERVAPTRPDEATLGEWFTRWDGGAWPVVIDRMALSSAGWGPKSRVVPPRVAPGRRGAANDSLRPLGLAVVPIGASLLITTTAEAPDRPGGPLGQPGARAAWAAALREASAWGNDPSDRFQTVARWRGEVTPRALNPDEVAGPEPAPEGRRIWRFAAAGWPGPDATVALVDDRRRAAWAWTAGLAVVVLGIAARGMGRSRRVAALTFLLLGSVAAVVATREGESPTPWGVLGGSAAVLFLWIGRALPRPGPSRESRPSSLSRPRPLGARPPRRRGPSSTSGPLSWPCSPTRGGPTRPGRPIASSSAWRITSA
jgi:hypothetical protein